jgi:hypothetical protein
MDQDYGAVASRALGEDQAANPAPLMIPAQSLAASILILDPIDEDHAVIF